MRGVIAAGHPLTAEAGATALKAGGNAVDAAVAAMLASFVAEPLLTGFGAGGYMLVAAPGRPAVLLDFFVEAPGRGAPVEPRAELLPVSVSFGDAIQVFNAGPASCGPYGNPSGVCEAHRRFATLPLAQLAEPAIALARAGVEINEQQGYIFDLLEGIIGSTPESRALFWVDGRPPRVGDVLRDPLVGDMLELLVAEGEAPFYTGEVAAAVVDHVAAHGGQLAREDLAAYRTILREPVHVLYRDREVVTNPPPSAGGTLIAFALSHLDAHRGPPSVEQLVRTMEEAQRARTSEFIEALGTHGAAQGYLANRLGSTTHISVLDADGWACSITATNGEGSGVVVPGTGIQLNNMMGEEDLSPLGFFTHPAGRRLPSMMAPTLVRRDGVPELVLGSAGSNRIRSAILQTIVATIDHGLGVTEAVQAPRVHWEDGVTYVEPGIDTTELEAEGRTIARFRAPNVFFGGVQAVRRGEDGELTGAGDPRRGGIAITVS